MAVVQLTAFMKDDDGHGWSETHNKDSGGVTPDITALLTAFDALMVSKRVPLLCGDSFYIGCRASFKTPQGATAGDNIERDPPMRGPQTFLGTDLNMTAPEAAIKMRLRNAGSTQKSDVYLRGFPKECIIAGVLNFVGAIGAAWKAKADQYASQLIADSYGWPGTNSATTSRGVVTNYVRQGDGSTLFSVTPTNTVVLPAAGTKLNVKFARLNSSDSVLNRVLVCEVMPGGLTLKSKENIAADEFELAGTYIATQISFIPYAALSYYRLSQRKTGRPFGVGPGRRPVEIRH
jgi:hypothetical protein